MENAHTKDTERCIYVCLYAVLSGIIMEKSQQREKILSHPKPLSPNQRKAVLSSNQHIRIIAGAGAGKTETLTR
jgi:UvrD/REP helicase N-terminal domain